MACSGKTERPLRLFDVDRRPALLFKLCVPIFYGRLDGIYLHYRLLPASIAHRARNRTGSNRFGSRTTALPANRLTRTTGGTRTGSWFDPAVQGRTVVRQKKWSWAGGVGSVYWPQNFIFFPMGEQKNDRWLQRIESENNGEIP